MSVYGRGVEETLYLAEVAEEAGFGRIWLGEHLVAPADDRDVVAGSHPTSIAGVGRPEIFGVATELQDPLVLLSAVGARTRRIGLGTAIYLLPLRSPVLTARAVATVQRISGSRLVLGVGQGWMREEFEAAGVPFDERRRRFIESIAVLRAAWKGGRFGHCGSHWDFGSVEVTRKPVKVPLALGGNGPQALRRAARLGDGWFCSGTPSIDEGLSLVHQVREHVRRERPGTDFAVYIRIPELDADAARAYAERSVDSVVIWADLLPPLTGVRSGDVTAYEKVAEELGFRRPDQDPDAMLAFRPSADAG